MAIEVLEQEGCRRYRRSHGGEKEGRKGLSPYMNSLEHTFKLDVAISGSEDLRCRAWNFDCGFGTWNGRELVEETKRRAQSPEKRSINRFDSQNCIRFDRDSIATEEEKSG